VYVSCNGRRPTDNRNKANIDKGDGDQLQITAYANSGRTSPKCYALREAVGIIIVLDKLDGHVTNVFHD